MITRRRKQQNAHSTSENISFGCMSITSAGRMHPAPWSAVPRQHHHLTAGFIIKPHHGLCSLQMRF